LFAGLGVARAQTAASDDVVTAISNLENDAVKGHLAGDPTFYKKVLAEDWTRGDKRWDLFHERRALESNGRQEDDTAVATYKDTYDLVIKGARRAHGISGMSNSEA
jgi:hypothetical protein